MARGEPIPPLLTFPEGGGIGVTQDKRHKKDRPGIVMATVYLRSKTGRSLLQGQAVPGDVRPYQAAPETVHKAVAELERRGFKIEAQGVTLSISGPPQLFEQTFGTEISFEESTYHEPGQTQPRVRFVYRSSKPVMHIPGLEDIIEGIVLAAPGIPF